MRYVLRDDKGDVISVHRDPVAGAQVLPADHPEVLNFLREGSEQETYASLDANLVRVLEDLIDVLIERNVLMVTDLPAEAQQKLFERKSFRSRAQKHALRLFGDEAEPFEELPVGNWPPKGSE
jgi:hypothetical protein